MTYTEWRKDQELNLHELYKDVSKITGFEEFCEFMYTQTEHYSITIKNGDIKFVWDVVKYFAADRITGYLNALVDYRILSQHDLKLIAIRYNKTNGGDIKEDFRPIMAYSKPF